MGKKAYKNIVKSTYNTTHFFWYVFLFITKSKTLNIKPTIRIAFVSELRQILFRLFIFSTFFSILFYFSPLSVMRRSKRMRDEGGVEMKSWEGKKRCQMYEKYPTNTIIKKTASVLFNLPSLHINIQITIRYTLFWFKQRKRELCESETLYPKYR